jgi:predicted PurR-regulated permease PerM
MRRGATRIGVAAYVGVVGLLVGLVGLVPLAGYVLAVVLPLLAARMRGREAARFAGLRTLAK